jgi:hypothetical protein
MLSLRTDCHSTLSRAIRENLQSAQMDITDLKIDTNIIMDASWEIKSDTTALRDDTAARHKHALDEVDLPCRLSRAAS